MLRNRALLTLWGGEFASRIGESVFQITLLWYLLELTESSLATGLVTMIAYLPAFIVGVWAGVVVDRMDYRRVMFGANVVRIALAASIPVLVLLVGVPVAGIAALSFLLTTATAFFNPARDALIPLLARRSELVLANSLVQSAWQFSLVVGPFLAAAALPFMRTESLFFAVSAAFALSLAVLAGLGFRGRPGPSQAASGGMAATNAPRGATAAAGASVDGAPVDGAPVHGAPGAGDARPIGAFLAEFRAGLGYLRRERRVWWIWIITLTNNFFLMGPVFVGIPFYVRTYLGGTGTDFALVEGTYAGGMIVATWLISRYGARFDPLRLLFAALIYDGLTYVPLLWVTSVEGTLVVILIHSIGIPGITISRITALHRIVPQPMQGRVFSYIHLAVAGMTALSIGVVGVVLTVLPVNWLFAIIGVLSASTGVLGWLLPVFRQPPPAGSPAA